VVLAILLGYRIAQQYHVPILSLGNEMLDATQPQYSSFWVDIDIINSVRQVYTGALTYSALLPLRIKGESPVTAFADVPSRHQTHIFQMRCRWSHNQT
jgi:hypothetical protein